MIPVRIQRKRSKGFNLQAESRKINGLDCVYVGRPSKWGNPFNIGAEVINFNAAEGENPHQRMTRADVVECFRNTLNALLYNDVKALPMITKELKGKNLACWCPLDQPCHADILLKIANEEIKK